MEFELSEKNITEVELQQFETTYNLNLPQSYRDLILQHNGGFPKRKYFQGGKVYFIPIKSEEGRSIKSVFRVADYLPEGYFPFADYNNTFLCICMEVDDYGVIYVFNDDGELSDVCDSFEEFLEELSETDDW